MQVVAEDQMESFEDPSGDTEEMHAMQQMKYDEALRRQYFEEQMRLNQMYSYGYSESNSRS